jgi:pyruvate/2-oxoglutarate/acetoin dehydrogenase E1 component
MRPIVEVMTCNFSLLCLDQIINNAATIRHMSGGQFSVPIVIRMATGAGRQLAAQHSHSLEGWSAHIRHHGARAGNVEDAHGMLLTAHHARSVLIFERPALQREGELPAARARPIDRAAVDTADDVSLITYGGSLGVARIRGVAARRDQRHHSAPSPSMTPQSSVRAGRTAPSSSAKNGAREPCRRDQRPHSRRRSATSAPVARICEVPIPYPRHGQSALPQVAGIAETIRRLVNPHVT